MERYLAISSDCHCGPLPSVMREHLDPKYRAQYDEAIAAEQATRKQSTSLLGGDKVDVWGKTARGVYDAAEAVTSGGGDGVWNPEVRARELDRDGVAGEIVFPGPGGNQPDKVGSPFNGGMGFTTAAAAKTPYELRFAGAQAYNRWLAEFLSYQPERHAGVTLVPVDDVSAAVAELKRARKSGLFGGLFLPVLGLPTTDSEAFWHHPRYEPIWDTLEELDVPVQTHSISPGVEYGDMTGTRWITSAEAYWTARRPLSMLVLSGILERHPRLRFVITEAGGADIPYMLNVFDYFYTAKNPDELRKILPMKPSEYWFRQCAIGASPHGGRMEVDYRHSIGVRNIMWGSDYPHREGSWPYSTQRMKAMFAGVPEDEASLMLGENAVRIYNFDHKKLRSIADGIGPKVSEFNEATPVAAGDWGRLWTENVPGGTPAG